MGIKIIITVPDVGQKMDMEIEMLNNAGFIVDWKPLDNISDTKRIIEAAKGYEYIIAGGELWDEAAIEGVRDCAKMIVRYGVGYDKVDLKKASECGIAVSNTPGRNSRAVAEHALALMLDLARGISRYDREIKSGYWKAVLSTELFNKTVGIVGFGSIARELAKLLKVFTDRIIAYDILFDKAAVKYGVEFTDLNNLLKVSDFVSLHVPLTKGTEGMVDEYFLNSMKSSAFLINTSRGKIVKEKALIEALREGRIAGAGLDVFEYQPVSSENPLIGMNNVVLTPHAASTNEGGFRGMMEGAVENILDFHSGKGCKFVLNPGYKK